MSCPPLGLDIPCHGGAPAHETTHVVCPQVIPNNTMVLGFPWHHQPLGI